MSLTTAEKRIAAAAVGPYNAAIGSYEDEYDPPACRTGAAETNWSIDGYD